MNLNAQNPMINCLNRILRSSTRKKLVRRISEEIKFVDRHENMESDLEREIKELHVEFENALKEDWFYNLPTVEGVNVTANLVHKGDSESELDFGWKFPIYIPTKYVFGAISKF